MLACCRLPTVMENSEIQLKFISTAEPEYAKECRLRAKILREPLGMSQGTEIFPFEKEALHLVAMDGDMVIGCLMFRPEGKTGRLLQMAVDKDYQKQGIGRRLVWTLESHLLHDGFHNIYLHARLEAVPFYEKMGYRIEGKPFKEIGIWHRQMRKIIATGN